VTCRTHSADTEDDKQSAGTGSLPAVAPFVSRPRSRSLFPAVSARTRSDFPSGAEAVFVAEHEEQRDHPPPALAVREAASAAAFSGSIQSARIQMGRVRSYDGCEQGCGGDDLKLQARDITTEVARDGVMQVVAQRYRCAMATTCIRLTLLMMMTTSRRNQS
jgi:hypothetical protein